MKKQQPNVNSPASFSYMSNYRNSTVVKSVKNYEEQVIDALTLIRKNPHLTLYDFENPFIRKLIADELVAVQNIPLFDLGRYHLKPQTTLRLTPAGAKRLDQPNKLRQ